ncbi:hypothetical protein Tco_0050984, partial [Tanacetum coccineum]
MPTITNKTSGRGDAEHSLPHLSCLPTMLIKMEDLISNLSFDEQAGNDQSPFAWRSVSAL